MSWYFLGGFSAYFSVPSGRRLNHSGWSVSHGWSAEHWIAKSRQISTPTRRPSATSASKSSSVPRSGWIASWPPVASRIAGGSDESVVGALAVREADRVDRRQVEDVEAELRQAGQLAADTLETAPGAREQLVPGPEPCPFAVDVELEGLRQDRRLQPVGRALRGVAQIERERRLGAGAGRRGRVAHDA